MGPECAAHHSTGDDFFIPVEEALPNRIIVPGSLQLKMFDAIKIEEDSEEEETTHGLSDHGTQALRANQDQNAVLAQLNQAGVHTPRNVLLLEGDSSLPIVISAADYLEFLEKKGPSLFADNKDRKQKKKILLKLAQDIQVLLPPNPSILGPDFDISQWRYILDELIKEMRIVKSRCSSEIRNSGVCVLTSTPYNLILQMLVEELSGCLRGFKGFLAISVVEIVKS